MRLGREMEKREEKSGRKRGQEKVVEEGEVKGNE